MDDFDEFKNIPNTTSIPSASLDTSKGEPLLDDLTFSILRIIVFIVLSFVFGLLGTGANIVNIVVFLRQGLLSGGSTLNLFFLSVADLGVVFTIFVHSIFVILIQMDLDMSWDPFSVIYLCVGWPHTIFMITNRILTAYVAFERCMCVVIPFKVQKIFTPQRSLVYILIIFAYSFISSLPIFLTHRLEYEIQEDTNSTKLVLVFGEDRDYWHDVVYYANFFVVSFLSVVVVFVCTIITSTHVTTSKRWREGVSGSGSSSGKTSTAKSKIGANNKYKEKGEGQAPEPEVKENDSTYASISTYPISTVETTNVLKTGQKMSKAAVDKETRLVKMITTISIIFLVCYVPMLTLIFMTVDDRIRTRRQYERLYHFTHGITFVSATINSSINIIVYYKMSSNYRKVFLSMFGRDKQQASHDSACTGQSGATVST